MKVYVYIIGICLVLGNFGCSDLIDVRPENSVTFTNYFKTGQDAEALLADMEVKVRTMMLTESPHEIAGSILDVADSYFGRGAIRLDPNTYLYQVWKYHYGVINAANLIIDNAHRFELPEETIQPYVLQAYFAKGLAYFLLARDWGEVPIIRSSTDFVQLGKSSVNEVLQEAVKYALLAMELPEYSELTNYEGKPRTTKQFGSKGAAAALTAHIYAWWASVEQNMEYWKEAEKYCTMIMEGKVGYYALAADPEAVCKDVMRGNSVESILEGYRSIDDNFSFSTYSAYFSEEFVGFPVNASSSMSPYEDYDYEMYKTTVNDLFDKNDLRRYAYFWAIDADSIFIISEGSGQKLVQVYRVCDGENKVYIKYDRKNQESDTIPDIYESGSVIVGKYDNEKIEKALLFKFRYPYTELDDDDLEEKYIGQNINKVFWRLADIILLRAECRARQNNPAAVDDLNRIRERAYGDKKHGYVASEGDLREVIFREREKELLFESHRYYDAVRNGREYVKKFLPTAYQNLTNQDIDDGALYYGIYYQSFESNELMKQNVYWNRRQQ